MFYDEPTIPIAHGVAIGLFYTHRATIMFGKDGLQDAGVESAGRAIQEWQVLALEAIIDMDDKGLKAKAFYLHAPQPLCLPECGQAF